MGCGVQGNDYEWRRADHEMVDHPSHYNSGGATCKGCGRPIECIDVIETMVHNRGAAIKYVWRADFKGKTIEDLKKARWYLDREIARVEGVG